MKKSFKTPAWFLLTPLGIAMLGTTLLSQAFPQSKSDRWQILIAYNALDHPPVMSQTVALRPNVPQAVFLFLKSPHHKEKVKVLLKALENPNKGVDVAEAFLEEMNAGVTTPLRFKPFPAKEKEKVDSAKAARARRFFFNCGSTKARKRRKN